jgi:hypothetical protein
VGFQVLQVVALNLVGNVLHINPQEKFGEVKTGDVGDPLQPIYLPAITLSK